MFALDTLSQTTLSNVPTFPAQIPASVDETCTVSDPFTAQAIFVGLRSESMTLSDEGPGSFDFYVDITNAISFTDTEVGAFNAFVDRSDTLTMSIEDIKKAVADKSLPMEVAEKYLSAILK